MQQSVDVDYESPLEPDNYGIFKEFYIGEFCLQHGKSHSTLCSINSK